MTTTEKISKNRPTTGYPKNVDDLLTLSLLSEPVDVGVTAELACHALGYPIPSKAELDEEMSFHQHFGRPNAIYLAETTPPLPLFSTSLPSAAETRLVEKTTSDGNPRRRTRPSPLPVFKGLTAAELAEKRKEVREKSESLKDHENGKNQLQEWCQKRHLDLPVYSYDCAVFGYEGVSCLVRVTLPSGDVLEGTTKPGEYYPTKKEAAKNAAQTLFDSLVRDEILPLDSEPKDDSKTIKPISYDPKISSANGTVRYSRPDTVLIFDCPESAEVFRRNGGSLTTYAKIIVVCEKADAWKFEDREAGLKNATIHAGKASQKLLHCVLMVCLQTYARVILVTQKEKIDKFLTTAKMADPTITAKFAVTKNTSVLELLL